MAWVVAGDEGVKIYKLSVPALLLETYVDLIYDDKPSNYIKRIVYEIKTLAIACIVAITCQHCKGSPLFSPVACLSTITFIILVWTQAKQLKFRFKLIPKYRPRLAYTPVKLHACVARMHASWLCSACILHSNACLCNWLARGCRHTAAEAQADMISVALTSDNLPAISIIAIPLCYPTVKRYLCIQSWKLQIHTHKQQILMMICQSTDRSTGYLLPLISTVQQSVVQTR